MLAECGGFRSRGSEIVHCVPHVRRSGHTTSIKRDPATPEFGGILAGAVALNPQSSATLIGVADLIGLIDHHSES